MQQLHVAFFRFPQQQQQEKYGLDLAFTQSLITDTEFKPRRSLLLLGETRENSLLWWFYSAPNH